MDKMRYPRQTRIYNIYYTIQYITQSIFNWDKNKNFGVDWPDIVLVLMEKIVSALKFTTLVLVLCTNVALTNVSLFLFFFFLYILSIYRNLSTKLPGKIWINFLSGACTT